MRIIQVFFAFLAVASAWPGHSKRCGHIAKHKYTITPDVDSSLIPIDVCEANRATHFGHLTKPLRGLIDKWLGRRHINDQERHELVNSLSWSITNFPSYANYTVPDPERDSTGGWNMVIHGILYKRRDICRKQVDKIINRILIRASITKELFFRNSFQRLNKIEAEQSRRQIRELATASIRNGAIQVKSPIMCNDTVTLMTLTNDDGAFSQIVPLVQSCSKPLETSAGIQRAPITLEPLNVPGGRHNESMDTQNTYLVPPRGLSIVSDVDDVLRVAEVWNWKQAIMDLFARPYEPWLNMDEVYRNWSTDIPRGGGGYWTNNEWAETRSEVASHDVTNVHFHYITNSPDFNAGYYIRGTETFFPQGSYDFRTMNFTHSKCLTDARILNIKRLLETFPERKFILVADTTSKSSMKGFPKLYWEHPHQIQCILIRDIEATEPANYVIPATRYFLDLPKNRYLFFRTPAGPVTPTLANLSTTHLASLAALEPLTQESGVFPSYISDLSDGCFPLSDALPQSKYPSNARGTRIRTALKLAWYKLKCQFIPRWRRPNRACPFDRRPGTKYWDKKVEPAHDW